LVKFDEYLCVLCELLDYNIKRIKGKRKIKRESLIQKSE